MYLPTYLSSPLYLYLVFSETSQTLLYLNFTEYLSMFQAWASAHGLGIMEKIRGLVEL